MIRIIFIIAMLYYDAATFCRRRNDAGIMTDETGRRCAQESIDIIIMKNNYNYLFIIKIILITYLYLPNDKSLWFLHIFQTQDLSQNICENQNLLVPLHHQSSQNFSQCSNSAGCYKDDLRQGRIKDNRTRLHPTRTAGESFFLIYE